MDWTQKELEEIYRKVNRRAQKDPAFAKRVMENPKEAVEEEAGCALPEGFNLNYIERDAGFAQTYVVPDFAAGEVNLSELRSVSGGADQAVDSEDSGGSNSGEMEISGLLILTVCGAAVSVGPCGGDVCGADACGADVCGGKACGLDACAGNVCAVEADGAHACGGKACSGDACGAVGCGGDACAGAVCGGAVCGGHAACAGAVCGADACAADGICGGHLCAADSCLVHGACGGDAGGGSGCGIDGGCAMHGCGGDTCVGNFGCVGAACIADVCGANFGCALHGCGGDGCGANFGCAVDGSGGSGCGKQGLPEPSPAICGTDSGSCAPYEILCGAFSGGDACTLDASPCPSYIPGCAADLNIPSNGVTATFYSPNPNSGSSSGGKSASSGSFSTDDIDW